MPSPWCAPTWRRCACRGGRSASSPTHRGRVAESVRAHLLRAPALVRADLVLPRWLVHRWAAQSPRIAVGSSLRAESFSPAGADRRARSPCSTAGRADGDRYRHAVPVEPPCLFVYGTLQPGRLRWPFLEPFADRPPPGRRARRAVRLRLRLAGRHVRRTRGRRPRAGHARRARPRTGRRGAGRDGRRRGDGHRPARARRRHDHRRRAPRGRTTAPAPEPGMARIDRWTSTDER